MAAATAAFLDASASASISASLASALATAEALLLEAAACLSASSPAQTLTRAPQLRLGIEFPSPQRFQCRIVQLEVH